MPKKVLRGYQVKLNSGIDAALARGARCVVATAATGGGKTRVMASRVGQRRDEPGIIQAHRGELVSQISLALAEEEVRHNIIGAPKLIKSIVNRHMKKFGRNFVDSQAKWDVASVDTIIRRDLPSAKKKLHVMVDEGHHVLRENKWGRGILQFPNATSVLFSATPCRADGLGLGVDSDGLADALVIGPGLASLIHDGYLVDYDVHAATTSDLDLSDVHIGPSGEFVKAEASRAVKRSKKIVGDIVRTYKEVAPGKRAIVFATDLEHAAKITQAFNAEGVVALFVSGEDEQDDRDSAMDRFAAGDVQVLVNVDLFGEGVDVPAVEVVIMARLTASFALYSQMIGRMLRLCITDLQQSMWDTFSIETRRQLIAESAKPRGVLIDHVGNVYRKFKIGDGEYGPLLPQAFNAWDLAPRRRKRGSAGGSIPTRICLGETCGLAYERTYDVCPFCGLAAPEPAGRSTPAEVDGKVNQLDPAFHAALVREILKVDGRSFVPQALQGTPAEVAVMRAHHDRQNAQHALRVAMCEWADANRGYTNEVNYSRFFFIFGLDVLRAMALGAADAAKLTEKIRNEILAPSSAVDR